MRKAKYKLLVIEIEASGWREVRGLSLWLNRAAGATLAALPARLRPVADRAQATVLLTSDKAVHRLNLDYRGVDRPTNVLSFPSFEPADLPRQSRQEGVIYVGDIALAYRYVLQESKKERKKVRDHAVHLTIHGLLHLFGYDHDTAAKASRMEKMEKEIMASLGLPDPYAVLEEREEPRTRGRRPV